MKIFCKRKATRSEERVADFFYDSKPKTDDAAALKAAEQFG